MKKTLSFILALIMVFSVFSFSVSAEDAAPTGSGVDLYVTVRDFQPDEVLFEGVISGGEGFVADRLGTDKKPVYNLPLWQDYFGESVTQDDLHAFFNDVPGTNMTTRKKITMNPDPEEEGFWVVDSSYDAEGNYLDGYFPIDNELFGNTEGYDHNYHFSVEIHTRFKFVEDASFEFSGDDDVWVFFNGRLVIDLGGVHGEEYAYVSLPEIAEELGLKIGDIVDFDMFYMERHTTGSNMKIRTNFDFLNLQASAWAQEELALADSYGLIPDALLSSDLTKPITRAEFAAVSVRVYEALTGTHVEFDGTNPFADCADPEVLKAYFIGSVTGTSSTTFEPDALLNREQAATMLTRVFKKVTFDGWTVKQDSAFTDAFRALFTMPEPFADDDKISSWARDSVYFMNANGIIKGVGGGMFAPQNTTDAEVAVGYANATREQALIIAARMVNTLGK